VFKKLIIIIYAHPQKSNTSDVPMLILEAKKITTYEKKKGCYKITFFTA